MIAESSARTGIQYAPAFPAPPPATAGRAQPLKRALRTAGLLVTLLLLSTVLMGCHDHSALEKQLADLHKEMQQLKMVGANTNVQLEDIENRVLLLQDQVDSNRLLLSRTDSGRPVQLPVIKLTPTLTNTPPQPVVTAPPTPSVSAESPAIEFHSIDENGHVVTYRKGQHDSATTDSASETVAASPIAAATPKRASKRFDSRPIMLYKQGMALLKEKKHEAAIAAFEDFLIQYPDHDYADNALYWVGEAYYDRQLFHKALSRFEQVVVQYPGGNKVPDAMLKAAFCYRQIGLRDRADRLLDKLIRTYPGTNAARLARKTLGNAN